jgi:hypothetical protein
LLWTFILWFISLKQKKTYCRKAYLSFRRSPNVGGRGGLDPCGKDSRLRSCVSSKSAMRQKLQKVSVEILSSYTKIIYINIYKILRYWKIVFLMEFSWSISNETVIFFREENFPDSGKKTSLLFFWRLVYHFFLGIRCISCFIFSLITRCISLSFFGKWGVKLSCVFFIYVYNYIATHGVLIEYSYRTI